MTKKSVLTLYMELQYTNDLVFYRGYISTPKLKIVGNHITC